MALEKEDIMALIAILQKGLEDGNEPAPKVKKRKASTKKTKTQKTQQDVRENKFDSMPERNMHKKDTIIDKKLWENLPVSDRTRQFQTVEVKCRSCGKTESVNPVLVDSVERYKCNRCSTSAG
jgi:hypothetical protein